MEKSKKQICFKEQTPNMLITKEKEEKFYKKAYLLRESNNTNEFAQNTTTWD